jgi:hypothetical protein
LAFLLSACVTSEDALTNALAPAPASDWKIERRVDRISGSLAPTALLYTRASNNHNQFPRPALLQLMCFNKQPIVRFAFDFRVGANKSAITEYRFDEKPGRKPQATFLPDYKTIIIEDVDDVAQFLDGLATSSLLYVRVSSLIAGHTSAEFRVPGAATAIDTVYAQCPLPGDRKGRKTA